MHPASVQRVRPAEGRIGAPGPAAGAARQEAADIRPVVTAERYSRLKARADRRSAFAAELRGSRDRAIAISPAGAPTIVGVDMAGVHQATACPSCRSPAVEGAIGHDHFVEVTNRHIDVYQRARTPRLVRSQTLAAFFRYSTTTISRPRVVYAADVGRWVVIALAAPESAAVERLLVAASRTSDLTDGFHRYSIDVRPAPGVDFDYPMLGLDGGAVIVTGNTFDASSGAYAGSSVLALPRSELFAGLPLTAVRWDLGTVGTIAPPVVVGSAAASYLLASRPADTHLRLFEATGLGSPGAQVTGPVLVDVPDYSSPPDAYQPGVTDRLDTLDARFVHASAQVGGSLFQAHSVAYGLAVVRWYEVAAAQGDLAQSGTLYTTGTSSDFNVSLAANAEHEVFMTWTSVDAAARRRPQVRISGRRADDPPGVISAGRVLAGSPASLDTRREPEPWGASSSVTLDPRGASACEPGRRAWVVNETALRPARWGTHIGRIGYC